MLSENQQINTDYDLYLKVSQGTLKSSLAMFVNLVVIVIAFYEISDTKILYSWLFIGSLILTLRSLDVYVFLKHQKRETLHTHTKRFKVYSLLLVICVSSGITFLTPSHLPFHQAFLAMIVAGLSAGAVMALSYYQNLIKIYLMILILPFASLMLLQGSNIHLLISFLMFFFLVMLMMFSKKFYESIIELIKAKNEADVQAHYDTLTQLANRLTLYDRLANELQKIKRHKTSAAILFIDLDDFKIINDTYGHHFGDSVLKEFAKVISSTIRAEDTFARLGGDEFVILVSNIQSDKQESTKIAYKMANKVHDILKEPLKVDTRDIIIEVSIGIDIIDESTQDTDSILNNADSAMYESKNSDSKQTTLFI